MRFRRPKLRIKTAAAMALLVMAVAASMSVPQSSTVLAQSSGICDRTQEVKDAILGKLSDVSACGDVTDSHLSGISDLNLSSKSISALKSGDFRGLTGLETLKLNDNSISSLPADVLDGLSSLETLWLYENQISSLSGDVFDDTSSLEELRLDHNQLNSLPNGVFDGLTNLRKLELLSNPGAPFTLTATLEASGNNAVVVKVAGGVPFATSVTLSAVGGSLSATTVELSGGTLKSEAVTVTPDSGQTGGVTVSVDSAKFKVESQGDVNSIADLTAVVTGQDYYYNGIQTGTGGSLTLENSPATGAFTIAGTAQVGQTLTADTSEISDADGLDNVSYSYQWLSSRDTAIDGATSSTYTLQSSDNGKVIKVRVTFTDDVGFSESLTSEGTSAVVLGGL